MILIAVGSNLPHPDHGAPLGVCEAAVRAVNAPQCTVMNTSRWFRSSPVPASDQPDYVNGVVSVDTDLDPEALLARLHGIEADFGRRRGVPNAARILDLDLLDYDDIVRNGEKPPILPHPRMAERAFVLLPLLDVAPDWRHPVSRLRASALAAALADDQTCVPLTRP